MKALIDGDIIRYELGFAAETGWQTEGEIPPFDYVKELFDMRLANILAETQSDSYIFFLSGKENFRNNIAKTKVYKGTRKENKPYHYANLTAYIKGMHPHQVSEGVEADDDMAIYQCNADEGKAFNIGCNEIIIVSRDKDLRQVPGWHYGWELGNMPSFGPEFVDQAGWIKLEESFKEDGTKKPSKLRGVGYKFFASQVLTGDAVDNIPGLSKCGPVKAYELLSGRDTPEELEKALSEAYREFYGPSEWEERLTEQAQLCWLCRRYNQDGSPERWRFGLYD